MSDFLTRPSGSSERRASRLQEHARQRVELGLRRPDRLQIAVADGAAYIEREREMSEDVLDPSRVAPTGRDGGRGGRLRLVVGPFAPFAGRQTEHAAEEPFWRTADQRDVGAALD